MTTALLTYPGGDRYDVFGLKWAIGGGEKNSGKDAFAPLRNFSSQPSISTPTAGRTVGGDAFMELRRGVREIGSTGRPIAGFGKGLDLGWAASPQANRLPVPAVAGPPRLRRCGATLSPGKRLTHLTGRGVIFLCKNEVQSTGYVDFRVNDPT
jgi:hypothetical protein